MRINIYNEELTDRVEVLHQVVDGIPYTGLRFYLELPATVNGAQYQGPFLHRPGDDDSSAVTFWSRGSLQGLFTRALSLLQQDSLTTQQGGR